MNKSKANYKINFIFFISSLCLLIYSYSIFDKSVITFRGTAFDVGDKGPLYSKIFLNFGVSLFFFSFYKSKYPPMRICPSCESVYTNDSIASCPQCGVPLRPLKGYYEEKTITADVATTENDVDQALASGRPLDGLTLLQAIPLASATTIPWIPTLLALPFALVLRHYLSMGIQTILVFGFFFAFFLQLEIHRGAMLSNPADMAPWRRRLVKVMLLMVAAGALNVALDRIVLT